MSIGAFGGEGSEQKMNEEVLKAVETRNELHDILRSKEKRWIGH